MREKQISRHWRILLLLDSYRYGKTVEEIVKDMEEENKVSKRTIYRDLDALIAAGFPITCVKTPEGTKYIFSEEYRLRLKLTFSPMELMALNLAIKSHNFLKGTIFHEALETVQNKIKATLAEKHQEYINSMANMFVSTFRPLRDYSHAHKIIDCITKALLEKKRAEITYWTPSRGKITKRKIEPYRLWFVNGAFYIIAYCHYRKEIRVFLLDRIREVTLTDETFTIPADFDFSQYTTKAFKVLAGDEDFEVVVRVDPLLKPQIMEQKWHPTQKVEELADGWLKVSFRLSALDEIKTWIQGYAPFIVVEKPPELVKEVVASFKEAIKLHQAKKS